MLLHLVGIQDCKGSYDGREYQHTKLYGIEKDYSTQTLQGERVAVVKVPKTFSLPPLKIGMDYKIYFNQYGQIEFIAEDIKKDPFK